jgi:hypothetical protein
VNASLPSPVAMIGSAVPRHSDDHNNGVDSESVEEDDHQDVGDWRGDIGGRGRVSRLRWRPPTGRE